MNSNDKLIALLKRRFAEGEEQTKHFENMCKKVRGYKPEDIAKLACMVGFIETVVVVEGHQSNLIGRYADQPTECNGVLTLTYGYLDHNGNMEGNRWIARIYFTARNGPRIGLPANCLKPRRVSTAKVDIGRLKGKDNNAFSPKDIKDFFKCPGNYLDWNKLKKR